MKARSGLPWIGLVMFAVSAAAEPLVVEIRDYRFEPAEIVVKAGATVRWENHERRQYHSVWFEATGEAEPDYFFPEEFYDKTFNRPGVYRYRCGPHPEMQGVVRVVE